MDVALMVPGKTTLTSPGVTGLIWEIGFESAIAPCRGVGVGEGGRQGEMGFLLRSAGPALFPTSLGVCAIFHFQLAGCHQRCADL